MGIGIEDYRSAVGRFVSVVPNLLVKKCQRLIRKSTGMSVGRVYSGSEITMFMCWVCIAALILFALPFCVFSVCDCTKFLPVCAADRTVTATVIQSDSEQFALCPDLQALLLCCGDIESNPGPTMEQVVRSFEGKMDKQTELLQGKLNQLIDVSCATKLLGEQLQSRLVSLESRFITENEKLHSGIEESKKAHEDLASRVCHLEDKIETQDRQLRQSNVVLYGLAESGDQGGSGLSVVVVRLLVKFFPNKTWNVTDIERVHRLGNASTSGDRPRPVLVRFVRWGDAMFVMMDSVGKEKLRGEKLRIARDMTQQQRDTVSHYKKQGMHAYFSKGRLTVTEQRRPVSDHRFPNPQPHSLIPHTPQTVSSLLLPVQSAAGDSQQQQPHGTAAAEHEGGIVADVHHPMDACLADGVPVALVGDGGVLMSAGGTFPPGTTGVQSDVGGVAAQVTGGGSSSPVPGIGLQPSSFSSGSWSTPGLGGRGSPGGRGHVPQVRDGRGKGRRVQAPETQSRATPVTTRKCAQTRAQGTLPGVWRGDAR